MSEHIIPENRMPVSGQDAWMRHGYAQGPAEPRQDEPHHEEQMYVVHAYGTKTCPQCGQLLFDDMSVCYGCMYDFDPPAVPPPPALSPDLSPGEEEVPTEAYEQGWRAHDEDEAAEAGLPLSAMPWLQISCGELDVRVPLPEGGLLVGRGPDCDVVLHARSVSRRHVRIVPDRSGAIVSDQGATNQAKLGDEPVVGDAHMAEGDVLNVCGTTLTLL